MNDLFAAISSEILAIKAEGPLLVAIDGVDGAGKSRFAQSLADDLRRRGRHVLHTSVDYFHNPEAVRKPPGKPLAESFFENSYNYQALTEKLLDPLKQRTDSQVYLRHFDHREDSPIVEDSAAFDDNTILVFDGIFLHRDELRSYWDFSIFLAAEFEQTYKRMAKRDGCPEDYRHEKNARYYQGQLIYLSTCDPKSRASIVIDNNDFDRPVLIKK